MIKKFAITGVLAALILIVQPLGLVDATSDYGIDSCRKTITCLEP